MLICEKCNKEFPNNELIDGKLRIFRERRFCLECVPVGTRIVNQPLPEGMKLCTRCHYSRPLNDFYARRGKANSSVYCRKCVVDQTLERTRQMKAKAVNYKGGKCERCGYCRSHSALQFHHRDPKEKEFLIGSARWVLFERLIPELDKCDLLCANCHFEVHSVMCDT